jgi:hypothetical protein
LSSAFRPFVVAPAKFIEPAVEHRREQTQKRKPSARGEGSFLGKKLKCPEKEQAKPPRRGRARRERTYVGGKRLDQFAGLVAGQERRWKRLNRFAVDQQSKNAIATS